jgi:RNA 3'-terminal phosphate cyclase
MRKKQCFVRMMLVAILTAPTGLSARLNGPSTYAVSLGSESVASDACESARSYLASGAAVREHLADQLLLPLALPGGGPFTAEKLNLHARTNIDVIAWLGVAPW